MDSFILILLIGFAAGVGIYYIDMKKGSRLYRWWYNLTHQHPLAKEVDKGFIHSRSFRQKMVIAIIVGIIELVIAYLVGSFHIIHDTITAASLFVGLLAGFVVAPLVLSKLPGGLKSAKNLINQAEKLEEKFIDDAGDSRPVPKSNKEPIPAKKVETETKKEEKEEKKKDWRDGVQDFLDK